MKKMIFLEKMSYIMHKKGMQIREDRESLVVHWLTTMVGGVAPPPPPSPQKILIGEVWVDPGRAYI